MLWEPRAKRSLEILECPIRYLIRRLLSAREEAILGFDHFQWLLFYS